MFSLVFHRSLPVTRENNTNLIDRANLVSEKVFTLHILQYAAVMGWKVMHISDSRRSYSRGFPDCLFVKPGRIIAAELKTVKVGRSKNQGLAAAQVEWRDLLRHGPVEWYLWTPADWGQIEEVLGNRQDG